MRSFLIELAGVAADIARQHFGHVAMQASTAKGRSDYVTFVDQRIEDVLRTRIRNAYPDHAIAGEEGGEGDAGQDFTGPCWIIDPIDGTTNFIRGIPAFCTSICFCDRAAQPRHAAIIDPVRGELFLAERDAGVLVDQVRGHTSGCCRLEDALVGFSLPFRNLAPLDDVMAVTRSLQLEIDDIRRSGSCALDLASVAVGRLDAFWELGIWPWDTAAGELMVRCGGGLCTDFKGCEGALLSRRSIVAAATPELHGAVMGHVAPLAAWLDRAPYDEHL